MIRGLVGELRDARRVAADGKSLRRIAIDLVLYRVLRLVRIPGADRRVRAVLLRPGVSLTYRLNRGDIQSIREVWFAETYRLPSNLQPHTLIDLGANIGLASVWFAVRYGSLRIVAVEPDPANAALARRNLADNGFPGTVHLAAISDRHGKTLFEPDPLSNLGRIGGSGREVEALTLAELVAESGGDGARLVKMDVEGAESAVIATVLDWRDGVDAVIAEFHPDRVDYPGLVGQLETAGFSWVPPGSVHPKTTDYFERQA